MVSGWFRSRVVWVSEIHFIDFFSNNNFRDHLQEFMSPGWFPGGFRVVQKMESQIGHKMKRNGSVIAPAKNRVSQISQFVIRDPSFCFAFRDPRFFGFSGFPHLHLLAPPWFCKTSGALNPCFAARLRHFRGTIAFLLEVVSRADSLQQPTLIHTVLVVLS